MFLVTSRNHYYSIRRFNNGEPLIIFDSLQDRPYIDNDIWDRIMLSYGETNFNRTNVYKIKAGDDIDCLDEPLSSSFFDGNY
jgi:hypothetical protein